MKKRFLEWLISFLMPGYHAHIQKTRARKEKLNDGNINRIENENSQSRSDY